MTTNYHNTWEEPYLSLLSDCITKGNLRMTRNGETMALFAGQMRFDLNEGFPLLTTKKVNFELILAELLWFIEGGRKPNSSRQEEYGRMSIHRLSEIYSKPCHIWDGDAQNFKNRGKAHYDGDCGRIYGAQWRDFPVYKRTFEGTYVRETKDQLKELIWKLKSDPFGRYARVTAWNPAEIDDMSLPACHCTFQCFVSIDTLDPSVKRLNLHMEQRSCDMFLGVPYNVASYAILLHMLAKICDMQIGELVITLLDYHVYKDHLEQVKEQLTRTPMVQPKLLLGDVKDIDDFNMNNVTLSNYHSHPAIKASLLTAVLVK